MIKPYVADIIALRCFSPETVASPCFPWKQERRRKRLAV